MSAITWSTHIAKFNLVRGRCLHLRRDNDNGATTLPPPEPPPKPPLPCPVSPWLCSANHSCWRQNGEMSAMVYCLCPHDPYHNYICFYGGTCSMHQALWYGSTQVRICTEICTQLIDKKPPTLYERKASGESLCFCQNDSLAESYSVTGLVRQASWL
jgi:hypothetical protein